ncbi:MAG: hypothetical protein GY805_17785 [Chloroflexi bacterium]|nr:hypothetical protein [Chloroflexota bacterium]
MGLGRLLALKDKAFSIDLYKWKRAHSQALHQVEAQELYPHKPHTQHPKNVLIMPKPIESWLSRLRLLQNVPFNYLVPDDTMLPQESLRFFTVDPRWVACLVDGAFSIGRVTENDLRDDATRKNQITSPPVSGFLLRSAVVSGWPSLQINGKGADGKTELPKLRVERLSPNVLLCLFQGNLKKLTIHEKPETIHFGFDPDSNSTYMKKLRTCVGKEVSNITIQSVATNPSNTQFSVDGNKRVGIDTLFKAIECKINENLQTLKFEIDAKSNFKTPCPKKAGKFNLEVSDTKETGKLNGAQFAMEMVAGVSSVTWQLR